MPGYKTPAQMTDNDPGLVHDVMHAHFWACRAGSHADACGVQVRRLMGVIGEVAYQTAMAMAHDTAAIEHLRGKSYDLMLRDIGAHGSRCMHTAPCPR